MREYSLVLGFCAAHKTFILYINHNDATCWLHGVSPLLPLSPVSSRRPYRHTDQTKPRPAHASPRRACASHADDVHRHGRVDGEIRRGRGYSRLNEVDAEHSDHGAVVGAQLQLRYAHFDAMFGPDFEQFGA
jgi:hypothetical protein